MLSGLVIAIHRFVTKVGIDDMWSRNNDVPDRNLYLIFLIIATSIDQTFYPRTLSG